MEIIMNIKNQNIKNPLFFKGIFFTLNCLVVFFLFFCKNPQDIEPNIIKVPVNNDTLNINGIRPFIAGTSWTYLVKNFNSSGSLANDTIIKVTLINDTIIENLHWYKTSFEPDLWQTNQTDGLRYRKYVTGNPLIEWLEAKYPSSSGFSWQKPSAQVTVVSVDSSETVSAGSFKCYLYYEIIPNGSIFDYKNTFYSPKIGMIQSAYFKSLSNVSKYLSQSWELISYKIGN